jgi:hypothetical protein
MRAIASLIGFGFSFSELGAMELDEIAYWADTIARFARAADGDHGVG